MTDHGGDITAFEAKTRLSELLREEERGRSFVIRRRGKPGARLWPYAVRLPEPWRLWDHVTFLFRKA